MEIRAGDILFLDTNILLTATDESRTHNKIARDLIASHHRIGLHFGISGQVIREYLVVATRTPNVNGLGMESADALSNVSEFSKQLLFFEESEVVSHQLQLLTRKYQLVGTHIHDANVVATLLAHGLSKLVTENPVDFSVFSEVETTDLLGFSAMVRQSD
jgi:predicted nucleic acid-binding protein